MAEAELRREGNLRYGSLRHVGLPADALALHAQVLELLAKQPQARPYGPPLAIIDLPPDEADPATWNCQVGSTLIGTAVPRHPLLVEDYRQLNALVRPHQGRSADLAQTVQALREEARAAGFQVRPYWRLALRHRRTPDGFRWPVAEVAVFVDR